MFKYNYYRVYLDKIAPLEQKLQYQIDKYVLIAKRGDNFNANDPLFLKPNPEELVSKEADEEELEEDTYNEEMEIESDNEKIKNTSKKTSTNIDANKKTRIYKPPKLAAVPYEEQEHIFLYTFYLFINNP